MNLFEISGLIKAELLFFDRALELNAQNIKNAQKPGFVGEELSFSTYLSSINGGLETERALSSAKMTVSQEANSLDNYVAESKVISGKYSAAVEKYNRVISLYNIAMNKGR